MAQQLRELSALATIWNYVSSIYVWQLTAACKFSTRASMPSSDTIGFCIQVVYIQAHTLHNEKVNQSLRRLNWLLKERGIHIVLSREVLF